MISTFLTAPSYAYVDSNKPYRGLLLGYYILQNKRYRNYPIWQSVSETSYLHRKVNGRWRIAKRKNSRWAIVRSQYVSSTPFQANKWEFNDSCTNCWIKDKSFKVSAEKSKSQILLLLIFYVCEWCFLGHLHV